MSVKTLINPMSSKEGRFKIIENASKRKHFFSEKKNGTQNVIFKPPPTTTTTHTTSHKVIAHKYLDQLLENDYLSPHGAPNMTPIYIIFQTQLKTHSHISISPLFFLTFLLD